MYFGIVLGHLGLYLSDFLELIAHAFFCYYYPKENYGARSSFVWKAQTQTTVKKSNINLITRPSITHYLQ